MLMVPAFALRFEKTGIRACDVMIIILNNGCKWGIMAGWPEHQRVNCLVLVIGANRADV